MLDGYKFFYQLPLNSKVGGVAAYVKKSLSPIVKVDLCEKTSDFESLWLAVSNNNVKHLVGGYYRHTNTPIASFQKSLFTTLNKIKRNKNCIVAGDFNIDLNKYSFNSNTTDYVDDLIANNYLPLAFCHGVTNNSATNIDHIYIKSHLNSKSHFKSGLITSDHLSN